MPKRVEDAVHVPLNLVRKLPDCLNSRVRCSPKPTLPGACECCARLNNTWLRWLFVCPGTVGRRLCPRPPPPRSPPRGSGGGLKPSSAAKAVAMLLVTVKRFRGISSVGKPPFVIPRSLNSTKSTARTKKSGTPSCSARIEY